MSSTAEQQASKRNTNPRSYFNPNREPCATEELIALFMLERAAEQGNKLLTPLEINKLVYIAHGWILGAFGRPLIYNKVNQIQAWNIGPVVVRLHYLISSWHTTSLHLYDFYSLLLRQKNTNNDELLPRLENIKPLGLLEFEEQNTEIVKGLDWVYEFYTQYNGGQLITLTTEGHSPWALNYRPGLFERFGLVNFEKHIPDLVIWDHYQKRMGR